VTRPTVPEAGPQPVEAECVYEEARPYTEELDVERLADAIRNVYLAPSASRDLDAQNIAAEYARLQEVDR
jgi:hypothetical protein